MTESKRSCELSRLVVTEGLCLPADSSLQACTLETVVARGCLSCLGAGEADIGHLHTQGTAQLPPGWQSLRWHVWGPGAWRWPGAVCSLRSAACCPSRWAPHSHFLRSWPEVGSQVQHSASWLSPLLTKKWIQHHPVDMCYARTNHFCHFSSNMAIVFNVSQSLMWGFDATYEIAFSVLWHNTGKTFSQWINVQIFCDSSYTHVNICIFSLSYLIITWIFWVVYTTWFSVATGIFQYFWKFYRSNNWSDSQTAD